MKINQHRGDVIKLPCKSKSNPVYAHGASSCLIKCRVGHLILRALAIRASDPKNALARISFHSPKNDQQKPLVRPASPLTYG